MASEKNANCRALMKAIRELDKRNPKPMELEGGGSAWWYVCPECRRAIDENDKFCRECGQAVKRE